MDDETAARAYAQTRDPALFELLVAHHQERVLRLVAGLLGPHADLDAQEVTQDIFLRVSQKLATFRGESRFSTWLYRLAYNYTLEHRRLARIRFPHVSEQALRQLAAEPFSEQLEQERRWFVAHLLEQLPDVYRTAIHMHYWLDLSVDEIAETLCVPAGTVKSYLFRAREMLREYASTHAIDL